MTPAKRVTAFRIDDDLLEGMQLLQQRDGIPFSEQIRRALRPWLEAKGVLKVKRKRATPSSRS